jgi:3'-phosphoadenosine 5'-phosphosulfate sulfotransferase (PAPS reductase)/FAD synthetase
MSAHHQVAIPDLTQYDVIAPQLSGGKDSAVTMWLCMDAARRAGVVDRVHSYHAALPVLDWPGVHFAGREWLGVAELAAAQSLAFGLPPAQHREVTRAMPGPDGRRMPHSLLTEIALYGRFPRMGTKYCTKSAKESVVSASWTPFVSARSRQLGRPVRILKVQGQRRAESRQRRDLPVMRTVLRNSARVVDEWLPALDWSTEAVFEWLDDYPELRHWTYDSAPGAYDRGGTSRCSCSLCGFASRRDLLISVGRRPRLAALYAEVEAVRGDSFRPDYRIHQLIHEAGMAGAPEPGVVCDDDTAAFDNVAAQVRAALQQAPRKPVDLARVAPGEDVCALCT